MQYQLHNSKIKKQQEKNTTKKLRRESQNSKFQIVRYTTYTTYKNRNEIRTRCTTIQSPASTEIHNHQDLKGGTFLHSCSKDLRSIQHKTIGYQWLYFCEKTCKKRVDWGWQGSRRRIWWWWCQIKSLRFLSRNGSWKGVHCLID